MSLYVNREALDQIVKDALTTAPQPLPRISAVVASKDEVLWDGAGGRRTFYADKDKEPEGDVSTDTPFAMFSNTKFVTCM